MARRRNLADRTPRIGAAADPPGALRRSPLHGWSLVGSPPCPRVRVPLRRSPSTRACSPPGPSGGTPTSPCPTRCSATSSSRPPGRPVGRTASPSASSSSPTARWPGRRSGCSARGHAASGRPSERPTATTRGSGADVDSPKARMARTMQHYVDTYESVPVLILACFVHYRHTNYTDGASVYPACQNLLLAARALGYGGVMTGWQFAGRRRAAGSAAHPRRGGAHGDHHHRPPAGPARSGAPAPPPRAGVRRAVGAGPRLGGRPAGGRAHRGGTADRQLIQSGCCARPAEGRPCPLPTPPSSTPTTTTTRRSTRSPATSTPRSGHG